MNHSLIEPGTRYFLSETLKNCNMQRQHKNFILLNIGLFLLFIIIIILYLAFKFKNKPTASELEKKSIDKQNYILSKLQNVIETSKIKNKTMITNLPKFESDYELLHEKFYHI
jgi:hypothetical protein